MFGHPNENCFSCLIYYIKTVIWFVSFWLCIFFLRKQFTSPLGLGFFRVYVSPRIYVISCCCYFTVSILNLHFILQNIFKNYFLFVHYIHIHTTVWKSKSKNSPEYHHMVWNGAANNLKVNKGISGPLPQHYKTPAHRYTMNTLSVASFIKFNNAVCEIPHGSPPPPQPGTRSGWGRKLVRQLAISG